MKTIHYRKAIVIPMKKGLIYNVIHEITAIENC